MPGPALGLATVPRVLVVLASSMRPTPAHHGSGGLADLAVVVAVVAIVAVLLYLLFRRGSIGDRARRDDPRPDGPADAAGDRD